MVFADIGEQAGDVSSDVRTGCLDTSDNLGDHFQPCVDLNITETRGHGMADIVVCAIFEPQCQQTKSVLQCVDVP